MKGGKHSNGKFVTSVYRYDPVAREMTCDFGGATNVYRYDADGKLLAVSIPGEGWATYSYNALGQNDAGGIGVVSGQTDKWKRMK